MYVIDFVAIKHFDQSKLRQKCSVGLIEGINLVFQLVREANTAEDFKNWIGLIDEEGLNFMSITIKFRTFSPKIFPLADFLKISK